MMERKDSVFEAIEQLQTLSHLFMQKRAALARSVGLTESTWRVLDEIEQEDFMPSLFASRRHHSKAAVSKILRQLLESSLITVRVSDQDGRARKYALTPEGKAKLDALNEKREDAIESMWKPLNPQQLDQWIALNHQLIQNLEKDFPS